MKLKIIRRMVFALIFFLIAVLSVSCIGSDEETITDSRCSSGVDVKLSDLLIENEDLPSGWFLGKKGIGLESYRSRDSAGSYYYSSGYKHKFPRLLDQMIYRHEELGEAESDYIYATDGDWKSNPPSDWDFQSTFADESGIFCRNSEGNYYCLWGARYGCIVMDMVGEAVPGYSTFEDMENIVRLVDEKAGKLLNIEED